MSFRVKQEISLLKFEISHPDESGFEITIFVILYMYNYNLPKVCDELKKF